MPRALGARVATSLENQPPVKASRSAVRPATWISCLSAALTLRGGVIAAIAWSWPLGKTNALNAMKSILRSLGCALRHGFRGRADLLVEVAALRQQLAVYQRQTPRPRLCRRDRLFWIWLCPCSAKTPSGVGGA